MQSPDTAAETTNLVETAVANGLGGMSCSESVFSAFGEHMGLPRALCLKLACGLAGGVGLMGQACGVVTASVLVLGLAFGPEDLQDGLARQQALLLAGEFAERFEEQFGSLLCRDLCHGLDMRTPEGARAVRESGVPEKLIRGAALMLEEMLQGRGQA